MPRELFKKKNFLGHFYTSYAIYLLFKLRAIPLKKVGRGDRKDFWTTPLPLPVSHLRTPPPPYFGG